MFFSLIAFAANSILCRLALKDHLIDATSFTLIRLLSGAIVLFIIVLFSVPKSKPLMISKATIHKYLISSIMLFTYAYCFSLAYIHLNTGTGALVLFAFVQLTLVFATIYQKQKIEKLSMVGLSIAFIGLCALVYSSLLLPSFTYFLLMAISGIAWGIYTLKGKQSKTPLVDTYFNFLLTLPFIIIITIYMFPTLNFTYSGVLLAIISGGVTSGLGYALWYSAIKHFTSIQSGVFQLFVPIIAAVGGIFIVDDPFTISLLISASLILIGIYLTLLTKK